MRTLRFAAFGTAMGPLIGKWLHILDVKFPLAPAAKAAKGAAGAAGAFAPPSKARQGVQLAKRVLADQAVAAPVGVSRQLHWR